MVFFSSFSRLLREGLVFIAVVRSSFSRSSFSCSSRDMRCLLVGVSNRSTEGEKWEGWVFIINACAKQGWREQASELEATECYSTPRSNAQFSTGQKVWIHFLHQQLGQEPWTRGELRDMMFYENFEGASVKFNVRRIISPCHPSLIPYNSTSQSLLFLSY